MSIKTQTPVHALTHVCQGGIANCIITPVEITNVYTQDKFTTNGIWDTGATNSVITKSTAQALGLVPHTKANVRGVHGIKQTNVYFVNIALHNKSINITTEVTECEELSSDSNTGMLLGMNIISQGDFAITNFRGNTIMTFRTPSLQCIDFVAGIKNSTPLVKDKIPGRNDPCYRGSDKKYKNCHGKNKQE